jgi:hypothetical protein
MIKLLISGVLAVFYSKLSYTNREMDQSFSKTSSKKDTCFKVVVASLYHLAKMRKLDKAEAWLGKQIK